MTEFQIDFAHQLPTKKVKVIDNTRANSLNTLPPEQKVGRSNRPGRTIPIQHFQSLTGILQP